MIEKALLEQFDIIADIPKNIPLLRRYIIDLAMRGKLVPKDGSNDTPLEITKNLQKKIASLVKQGTLKKQKQFLEIGFDEIPSNYLGKCTFQRLGNVAYLQKGLTGIQSALPGEYPLVVTASARLTCDHYDFDGAAAIIPMVSSTGHGHASLNRLHYQEGKFALGTILCAVFPIDEKLISARFIFEYLTAFKDDLLVSKMNGTANVTLSVGKIAEVPVPIISPAAQRRVDELMSLCDQLEAERNKLEVQRDRLVGASLNRIHNALEAQDNSAISIKSGNALHDASRFHFAYLSRFTTRPEHIKQLRETILNLAIRGCLATQNSSDEPAAILYKKILSEKSRLIKVKPLSSINEKDYPFAIPNGWKWVRLGQICSKTGSGSTPKGGREAYPSSGIMFLRSQNVYDDGLRLDNIAYIAEETHQRMKGTTVLPGDLLLNITGGSIGRCARVPDNFSLGNINQHIAIIRLAFNELSAFTHLIIISPYFQNEIIRSQTGAGREGLPKNRMDEILVPLPPLAEQHRIVAKVHELMSLCDRLEAQLTVSETESYRLLEAILHKKVIPISKEAA